VAAKRLRMHTTRRYTDPDSASSDRVAGGSSVAVRVALLGGLGVRGQLPEVPALRRCRRLGLSASARRSATLLSLWKTAR
jgi:hypothetical protein